MEVIRRRLPGHHSLLPDPGPNGLIHPDWIAAMFWLMEFWICIVNWEEWMKDTASTSRMWIFARAPVCGE
ncbi:MAG: hypothetical protein MZV64_60540 [Ignavibacteriales bacterium]|nr:hypothetical protein [Ignavibacteriales bacterium]